MKDLNDLKLSSRQLSILQNLSTQTITPKNLESMYYGALKVLNDDSNPEKIYLAAHCLRELTYYLTDLIRITDEEEMEKKEKLRQIYNKFKDFPDADQYDLTLFDDVIKNFKSQRPIHREQMRILIKSMDELGGIDYESIINQWHELHGFFVDVCHHRIEPVDIDEFKKKLHNLELILFGLFGPFYESIDEIDKLIEREIPDKGDIEELKSLIKGRAQFNYFFLHLNKSGWLIPLKTAKLLDKVPRQGEYSVVPIYLRKIADKMPDEVTEIIKKLSNTNHQGAQIEFIKAIQKIPFKISKKLTKNIERWYSAREGYSFSLEMEIIRYIKQLFSEGHTDEAFGLSKHILFLRIEEKTPHKSDFPINYTNDGYFYEMKLNELIPDLCEYKPIDTVTLFCKHLNWYLENNPDFKSDQIEDDLSIYWRLSIENDEGRKDINNILVNTIRDCLKINLAKEEKRIDLLLSILKNFDKTIFRRFELYLFLEYPDLTHSYFPEFNLTKYEFDTLHRNFELKKFLSLNFSSLSEKEQIKYLQWINEGPSHASELNGRFIKNWQLENLKLIESHLKDSDIFSLKIDPIELKAQVFSLDRFTESSPQFFPETPLDEKSISNLSLDDLVELISDLSNKDESESFSQEGFGRSLRNIIIKEPESFIPLVKIINNREDLHWITHFLLDGFKGALHCNKTYDLDSIIRLCTNFLIKKDPYNVSSSWNNPYPLRNLKVSLGWFIEEVLRSNALEFDRNGEILDLITVLLNTDDEFLPSMKESPRDSLDLRSRMSNTFPGIALSCLFEYIRWFYQKYLENKASEQNNEKYLKVILTIKKLMKDILDFESKQSYTIFYTFGVNLHILILFDREWVEENINILFPRENEHLIHWSAILSGFLDFNYLHSASYSILHPEFLRILDLLKDSNVPFYLKNSINNFVEQIMYLYLEGIEDLKNENSLLWKFFESADDNLRMVAIRYVGSMLKQINQKPDFEEIIHKLKDFYLVRIQFIKSRRLEDVKEELSGFLFWIVNTIFDKDFTMNLLKDFISLSKGAIGVFYDVLDVLNSLMNDYPKDVLFCLYENIKHEFISSDRLIFIDKYRPILEKGINHEDKIIQTKTKEIINYIGKKGQHEFRDLLN
ncbi:MAG: hypothetical protein ACFFBI_05125 [Promethearchaeota archaeon]